MRITDLVDVTMIADRLGVLPGTVHKWRQRHADSFPAPVARFGNVPVWDYTEVSYWYRYRKSLEEGRR